MNRFITPGQEALIRAGLARGEELERLITGNLDLADQLARQYAETSGTRRAFWHIRHNHRCGADAARSSVIVSGSSGRTQRGSPSASRSSTGTKPC